VACLPKMEAIEGAGEGEREGAWAPASLSADVGPALKSPKRVRWPAVKEREAPGSSEEEPDPVPCSSKEGPKAGGRVGGGASTAMSTDCFPAPLCLEALFLGFAALRALKKSAWGIDSLRTSRM
jgi:hypothetical protein